MTLPRPVAKAAMEKCEVSGKEIVDVRIEDGVAIITVDAPPVNTITAAVRAGLDRKLDQLTAFSDLKAVVLACGGSTFFPAPTSASSAARRKKPNIAHCLAGSRV